MKAEKKSQNDNVIKKKKKIQQVIAWLDREEARNLLNKEFNLRMDLKSKLETLA